MRNHRNVHVRKEERSVQVTHQSVCQIVDFADDRYGGPNGAPSKIKILVESR